MSTQGSEAGYQVFPDEEEEEEEEYEFAEDVEELESNEAKANGKRQKTPDLWEGFYILKHVGTNGNSLKCPSCNLPKSGKKATSLLEPYDSDVKRNSRPDFDGARRALVMTIISTGQSLSLVEGFAFQSFSRALNPLFPMHRSVLDRDVMDLYKREKNTLRSIMCESPGALSFAVEKWKSKETGDNYNDDIYLCITACFVDADWKLQRRVVGFKLLEFPEDAMYVADTIASCFTELKVDNNVISINLDSVLYEGSVVDSLKNVLHDKGKLMFNGQLYQVHCCTDILNSIMQAGQDLIADVINKIRQGIRYINYSATRKNAFYQYAKDTCHLDVTTKLCADLVIYWDSTYKMLTCALYYKDALNHFASTDGTFLAEFHLSDEEWSKVTVMEKFLKPVYDLTCIFLSAKYKTANLYFLGLYKISRLLQVATTHDNFMSAMVKDMKVKFDKYWSDNGLIVACAAVLDPRYKLKLINYCFRKIHGDADAIQHIDRVFVLLQTLFNEYKKLSASSSVGGNVVEYHANDDLFDYPPQEHMSELDWYLESPTMDFNTELDILEFWSGMSKCYPHLANLARDVLAIPISTVATKSVFTVGDKVLNRLRGTLSPDLLEMLTCLHNWTCPKDRNGIAVSAIEEYCTDDDEEEDIGELDDQDEDIEEADEDGDY